MRSSPGTFIPLLRTIFCASLLFGTLACQAGAEVPAGLPGAGGFGLTPCSPPGVGEDAGALCGTLTVAENPAEPEGRSIDLHVVVLSATGDSPQPDPIVYLEGGPGVAATLQAPALAASSLRRDRAIVLMDQRGTGRSHPLECDTTEPGMGWQGFLPLDLPDLTACREAQTADLRFYHTTIAVGDLEKLRRALGVETFNLWGGSYGTRVALVYLREYPDSVRSAVLMSVAPPTLALPRDVPRDAQAALDGWLAACASEPECHRTHPSLERQLADILERLGETPATVTVREGGESLEVRLTRDLFAAILRFALYDADQAVRIPGYLEAAHRGEYEPIARVGATFGRLLSDRFQIGMMLSVMCSEDVAAYTPDELRRAAEGTFLGRGLGDNVLAACAQWPAGEVPEDFHQPVASEVPILMLAGELDPVTPPRHALEAARHLPNSRVVSLPFTAHFLHRGKCIPRLMRRFFDTADVRSLDAGCLERLERPDFPLR